MPLFGGVAQMVRARGSYPRRRQFDSVHRHQVSPRESQHLQSSLQLEGFSGDGFFSGLDAIVRTFRSIPRTDSVHPLGG
jgi:hypothetical protein